MTVASAATKMASATITLNGVTETGSVQTAKTNGNVTERATSWFIVQSQMKNLNQSLFRNFATESATVTNPKIDQVPTSYSVMFVDMAPFSAPGQIQAFLIASPKISFVMDLMTALMVQMSVLAHLQMRDEFLLQQ